MTLLPACVPPGCCFATAYARALADTNPTTPPPHCPTTPPPAAPPFLSAPQASLVEQIARLVDDGVLTGVSDVRDESDRDGLRVVVEVKRGGWILFA